MRKKNIILICCIVIVVIVLAVSTSYAIFTLDITKNTDFKLVIGTLELSITDTTTEDKIIMENTVPTKDEVALNTDGYTFTITNTGTIDSYYTVYLDDILIDSDIDRLDNSYVKINLLNQKTNASTTNMLSDYDSSDRILETGFLKPNESITYILRMWVDYNAGNEAQNKYFASQIRVVGTQSNAALAYKEEILNGADPVLTDNLIPIKIEDDGTVTKADIGTKWYSYEDKEWANAVVLKEDAIVDSSSKNIIPTKLGSPTVNNDSITFDGIDDAITLGYENYSFSNGITMTINFKMSELDNYMTYSLFGNWENGGGGIYVEKGRLTINFYISELKQYYVINYNTILNKDTYYSVVATYDNEFIKLYVNGKLENTASIKGEVKVSPVPIMIGGNPGGIESTTTVVSLSPATVTSAILYDRVVTEEEVLEYYQNENITNQNNILFNYQFGKLNNNSYKNNQIIVEDAIESYFVWIPKYSYQLWDLGNYDSLTTIDSTKPHAIPIKFGLANTSDSNIGECTTPMNETGTQGLAGESGNCVVGDYMTHPAFLSFNTNGLWVGKFETGYYGANITEEAQVNSSDFNKVIIKPNVYSWRGITVGNSFKASYDYLRNDESHMMKNTEWGAVAYLSHSNYGIATSIRINNNSKYITGYAATIEPSLGYNAGISIEGNRSEETLLKEDGTYTVNYLNNLSSVATTTNNKSGIYDISGGAWEYVVGYTNNAADGKNLSEIISIYSDFFTNSNWNKYYDKYESILVHDYSNRILGDATGETGSFYSMKDPDDGIRYKSSWYNNYAYFAYSKYPWFLRGGNWHHGADTGSFAFNGHTGVNHTNNSYRIVLAPTK